MFKHYIAKISCRNTVSYEGVVVGVEVVKQKIFINLTTHLYFKSNKCRYTFIFYLH